MKHLEFENLKIEISLWNVWIESKILKIEMSILKCLNTENWNVWILKIEMSKYWKLKIKMFEY